MTAEEDRIPLSAEAKRDESRAAPTVAPHRMSGLVTLCCALALQTACDHKSDRQPAAPAAVEQPRTSRSSPSYTAGERIALVIGNSAYQNIPQLDNPKNDAALIARTLKDLGFTLIDDDAQVNLDKEALDRAVQKFGRRLQGAEIALFYYAGHGVQVRGSNYLVPINANPTRSADVDFEMLDVSLVLRQMESSGSRLNLVILDACRNNPFGGRGLRGSEPGLAQMRAPEGTLISYATQPGNVAQDGADHDSPYTKALAATLRRPGLDIFQTFNEVGLAVKRATGGEQQPWTSSSPIDGNYYFAGPPIGGGGVPPAPLTPPGDSLQLDLVTDCDRLAASPADPARPRGVAGVALVKVDIVPALAACRDAMRQYPDVARFVYQSGRIAEVQGDKLRARPLYEQAASLGSGAAMNNLGNYYADGIGTPIDLTQGRRWYEKAAAAGVVVAMTNIGNIDERQTPPDFADARRWYLRAATAGEPGAMNGLGVLYENGSGVPQDPVEARQWYQRAAGVNNAEAMHNIGRLYYLGKGVDKNFTEARKWWERAASLQNGLAMHSLGRMYEKGEGVPVDMTRARSWYEQGAAIGCAMCMTGLAELYEAGLGVPKNETLARQWYEKAMAAGDEGAKRALKKLDDPFEVFFKEPQ